MSNYGWTSEQDRLLAEIVLSYLKNGKTRIAAFEIAGAKLSKTANTCKARWDNVLRDQYNISKETSSSVIDPDTLGNRLRALRTELKLTQEEVGKKVCHDSNDSRVLISNYELNRAKPTFEVLVKLSDFFNVSCDYLLRGKEFERQ